MGLKFANVKRKLHQDKMHEHYIKRLIELGVTHSQLGRKVTDLDYDEAHYEYVLAAFKAIDAESDSNRWY